jgi:hypothetical protein
MSGKIIRYEVKTDIFKGKRYDDFLLSKDTPFISVYNTAIAIKSKVIIKAGINGKWYLKGKDKQLDVLQQKINEKKGLEEREGFELWLIEL